MVSRNMLKNLSEIMKIELMMRAKSTKKKEEFYQLELKIL